MSVDLSQIVLVLVFAFTLIGVMKIYFRFAAHYKIVDSPNERSSHQHTTIRGGGIVFLAAISSWFIYSKFEYPWMFLGVVCIGCISFLDDYQAKPAWQRFVVHLIGMLMLFYQLGLHDWPSWLWITALVVSIGALNAFNFMDGINGMTGVYALVSLMSFFYVNWFITPFIDESLITSLVLSVLVFLFYNFRKSAICFAGDVGSIVLGFILIFMLFKLVVSTNDYYWVLFLLVYGVDSVITIVYRLKGRDNIFKPHRTHLYQYLTNEFKWSHRSVSIIYGAIQFVINGVVISAFVSSNVRIVTLTVIGFVILYLVCRTFLLRKIKLNSLHGSGNSVSMFKEMGS